jgi:hypothetical protein
MMPIEVVGMSENKESQKEFLSHREGGVESAPTGTQAAQ